MTYREDADGWHVGNPDGPPFDLTPFVDDGPKLAASLASALTDSDAPPEARAVLIAAALAMMQVGSTMLSLAAPQDHIDRDECGHDHTPAGYLEMVAERFRETISEDDWAEARAAFRELNAAREALAAMDDLPTTITLADLGFGGPDDGADNA